MTQLDLPPTSLYYFYQFNIRHIDEVLLNVREKIKVTQAKVD